MTSINFGLTIAAFGTVAVFSILLLVIVFCEVLKRVFLKPVPVNEPTYEETEGLTDEELAVITASVAYFMESSKKVPIVESSIPESSRWSQAGRLEIMSKQLRG